jgi:hypothetical protein
MSKENNSKSSAILQRYTPEAIQEFLNSGESKSSIVERLGWYMEALNKYIKEHNLTYDPSRRRGYTKMRVKKYKETIPVQDLNSEEAEDPVKKFYEMLARKKEKRALRELKNPYDW